MAADNTEKCHSSNIASLYAQNKLQKHCLFSMECKITYCKAKIIIKASRIVALFNFHSKKFKMVAEGNGQHDVHINNTIIVTLQLSKHPHLDLNA